MELATVAVKLPTFWSTSPVAWFAQAEAQFALRGILADETKYYHVVAALDTDTANRALSILTAPPSVNKYDTIKQFLLSAYQMTEEERAQALFNLQGLGDNKPSVLMDKMLALLGNHEPCFLFRHIFLQQLPDFIRAPLANSASKQNPRLLAQEADQLFVSMSTHFDSVHQVKDKQARKAPTEPQPMLCWYHRK